MKKLILPLALLLLLLGACTPFGAAVSPTATIEPTNAPVALEATPTPAALLVLDPLPTLAPELPSSPSGPDLLLARLNTHERLLRDQVALAIALGNCRTTPDDCPVVARETPLEVEVGYARPFFVTDLANNKNFEINAELRYAGPVVLMYVEEGLPYNQQALERAAQQFEQEIYPRTREVFGSEVQPGVDGDRRITILNARDPSNRVLGYYSSQDSLPSQVNRYSNEREMFFM
ncbi:MAG: hypothetical protein EI684_12150, partial [Candidatus Viridilinea halotolerans]